MILGLVFLTAHQLHHSVVLKLGPRVTIRADWVSTDSAKYFKQLEITLVRGNREAGYFIPTPPNAWLDEEPKARFPVSYWVLNRKRKECILDITYSDAQGVYGDRTVHSFLITPNRVNPMRALGQPFGFTDDGSWHRLSSTRVAYWGADLDERVAHQAAHHYWLKILEQRQSGNLLVRKYYTRHSYNIGYDESGDRPIHIPAGCDPLRELGYHWKWWGEPGGLIG